MSKSLIAFGYKRRVGKTEAANHTRLIFKHYFNMTAETDSFARPIKDACRHIFGFRDEHFEGDLKEKIDKFWGLSPREALQKVGTDLFRNGFRKDIWVKSLENRFLNSKSDTYIISDLRFKEEVELVKKYNGYLVKVERDRPSYDPQVDNHSSENDLNEFNGWNVIIKNNGTLDEFYKRILEHFLKESKND